MAHKKGLGSSRNGRDSKPKMLGVKLFAGQDVMAGMILVRQRGTRFRPGPGTGIGKDDTIFATRPGKVAFRTSGERRYISVNPAMARMFGYDSPEEVIAIVTDIAKQSYVEPRDYLRLRSLVEEQGEVRNFEHQRYRKDGSKMWLLQHVRVVKKDGTVAYFEGMCEDITERKLLEDQLRQAQKMEAVGRLAGAGGRRDRGGLWLGCARRDRVPRRDAGADVDGVGLLPQLAEPLDRPGQPAPGDVRATDAFPGVDLEAVDLPGPAGHIPGWRGPRC